MKITYTQNGDYLLPNISAPKVLPYMGKYASLRLSFLKHHKQIQYTALLLSEKLESHLQEIQKSASERIESMVKSMAKAQSITETLKAENQMEWVGLMNNFRQAAEEITLKELIYT